MSSNVSCDFVALANPGVQKLSPYQPGKPVEELERELGIQNIVKLASNENPLGASPQALKAAAESLQEVHRYPDGSGFHLKKALAERLSVSDQQVTLGNGSNDVLEFIARVFLREGNNSVFSEHAFAVYPLATLAAGATPKIVPAKDYGADLEAMLAAIDEDTRIVFLANPNNPTGTWVEKQELEHFIARVPENVVVVLDEAYYEYVAAEDFTNGISLLKRFSNLVVTRTFSKAYGLAGLRVGYAVSSETLADLMNRVRQPFNVSIPAMAAAVAALDDEAWLQQGIALNKAGYQQLSAACDDLSLPYIPSKGNFISVELPRSGAELYPLLLKEGVIVRPVDAYGMPQFLRVSIGNEQENERFIQAIQKVLND